MEDYIIYRCEICGLPFIIPTDGLRLADVNQRYLSCPLGHRPVTETGRFEGFKQCMESKDTYKKSSGRVKQVGYGK